MYTPDRQINPDSFYKNDKEIPCKECGTFFEDKEGYKLCKTCLENDTQRRNKDYSTQ